MVDGMKTVAMYQRHLQISIAPPLWLNVKKASQKSCNSAKVSINYAFLESVVRSVSVFSFVHPIQGTPIDFIIIRAVDLAKTSFLALVTDYVLVFSWRLLLKKTWHILTIRLFSRTSLNCWRRKKDPKMMPEQLPIQEPIQPNWISKPVWTPGTFKFLLNPAVSFPHPYFIFY